MNFRFTKNILRRISNTCLHPQWFVYKENQKNHREIGSKIKGRVLDIGCADQFISKYLPANSEYLGLDYYQTAIDWYNTRPNVFGDAQRLPFADETMDSVLLLDVLEHIPDPNLCMTEISRVLKKKGILILQVPFVYPIHDAPLDFQRWTSFGLHKLAEMHGFSVKEEKTLGKSVETAGLLFNISLCKLVLAWAKRKHPAVILFLIIGPLVVLVNVFCWLLAFLSSVEDFMPHGYRLILEKDSCDI